MWGPPTAPGHMRTAGEALPCRRQQNRHLRHGGGGTGRGREREGERERGGEREGEEGERGRRDPLQVLTVGDRKH